MAEKGRITLAYICISYICDSSWGNHLELMCTETKIILYLVGHMVVRMDLCTDVIINTNIVEYRRFDDSLKLSHFLIEKHCLEMLPITFDVNFEVLL
jgi:hypothetical protein